MEENEEDINDIPIVNLPDSGLTVFKYEEWAPGDPVAPNNLLISCLDQFDRVALVGRERESGLLFYASSSSNTLEIANDLRKFIHFLEYSSNFTDND